MGTLGPHSEGWDLQARVIAAKPDFTAEQWEAVYAEQGRELEAMVRRMEVLEGRRDALRAHVNRLKGRR